MRYVIFILSLLILGSCGQKHWKQRGIDKGWLDTSKTKNNDFDIKPKVAEGDSAIKDFVDSISHDVKKDTGKELSPETKEKIRWRTRTEFIPTYIKTSYPDTTITFEDGSRIKLYFDTTGAIRGTQEYKPQIILPEPPEKLLGWDLSIWAILLFLLLFFIAWRITKK
jgi:hypothetical protein